MLRGSGLAVLLTVLATVAATSACGRTGNRPTAGHRTASISTAAGSGAAVSAVPLYDHIVVAVLENHAYTEIIGQQSAPFLNSLAERGALLTQSYAITHPSQPNYLAMFSGSTQGLTSDSCPHSFAGPNLAGALLAAGRTFIGYSEDLPAAGFTGCGSGDYARKHNPWVDFPDLPSSLNQPLTAFPDDLSRLPNVAFVIANLRDDMHDGTVAQGDQWLQAHLGGYADWSASHNSLLIVTADEDDRSNDNRIATFLAGAHVLPGRYSDRIDHYGLLRTLLASNRLEPFGAAAQARLLTGVWAG